jgi:hypothetical protein
LIRNQRWQNDQLSWDYAILAWSLLDCAGPMIWLVGGCALWLLCGIAVMVLEEREDG